jgi:hypothetical protein
MTMLLAFYRALPIEWRRNIDNNRALRRLLHARPEYGRIGKGRTDAPAPSSSMNEAMAPAEELGIHVIRASEDDST